MRKAALYKLGISFISYLALLTIAISLIILVPNVAYSESNTMPNFNTAVVQDSTVVQNSAVIHNSAATQNSAGIIDTDFPPSTENNSFEMNTNDIIDSASNISSPRIKLSLNYTTGSNESNWDADGDGVEFADGFVDFSIAGSSMNFYADQNRLCALYEINVIDTDEVFNSCHGTKACCDLFGHSGNLRFSIENGNWNSRFVINPGKFSKEKLYVISAQAAYLSEQNASSNILSNVMSLTARFIDRSQQDILTILAREFASQITLLRGKILTLSTMLLYENKSPVASAEINLYRNETFIQSKTTNESGEVIFNFNTIYLVPGDYMFKIIFPGQFTISEQQTIWLQPSLNFTVLAVLNNSDELNLSNLTNNSLLLEEELTQGRAEIGRKVSWKKEISITNNLNETQLMNLSLEIPIGAEHVIVSESVQNDTSASVQKQSASFSRQNNYSDDVSGILNSGSISITGNISPSEKKQLIVEFETSPPMKNETSLIVKDNQLKKNITVFSNSSLHYEDVYSYTKISESSKEQIHLYWHLNRTVIDIVDDQRFEVSFYDTNSNGLIDQISWIVPNLSEQIFELVIDLPASLNVYREMAHGTGLNNEVTSRFVIISSGYQNISSIIINETIPSGWQVASLPSYANLSGDSVLLDAGSLGMNETKVVNYTLISPAVPGNYTFITKVDYHASGLSEINLSDFVVESNDARLYFEVNLDIYSADNVTTRGFAANADYEARFSIKEISGNNMTKYPTLFYWVFNDSVFKIDKDDLSNDCRKGKIISYRGKKAIYCEWKEFAGNEVKGFTLFMSSKYNGNIDQLTYVNVTYDPEQDSSAGRLLDNFFNAVTDFFARIGNFILEFLKRGPIGFVINPPDSQPDQPITLPVENPDIPEGAGLDDAGSIENAGNQDDVVQDIQEGQGTDEIDDITATETAPQEESPASDGKLNKVFGPSHTNTNQELQEKKAELSKKVWHSSVQEIAVSIKNISAPEGMDIPFKFNLRDGNDESINSRKIAKRIQKDKYHLELDLRQKKVQRISFDELTIKDNETFELEITDVTNPVDPINNQQVVDVYVIDPTSLNFTNATVTSVAKGSALWKCVQWNKIEERCDGSWQKLRDIVPGEEYSFVLTPEDPAYAETGVASINTRKSRYHLNETADIVVVVLDTSGHLVSGANVSVSIEDPIGATYNFSTINLTISETLGDTGVYELSLSNTSIEGEYSLRVEAFYSNGSSNVNSSMISSFIVASSFEYDIIRYSPVTTDPFKGPFDSTIKVVSYTNSSIFNVTEKLPSSFAVLDSGNATVVYLNDSILLRWENVNNNSELSYVASPPLITPDLWELGPVVVDDGEISFEEARPWFLAVDPITIINVQSRPTVGGLWAVQFTTNGTADLKIRPINGTRWSNVNESVDLKFLSVKCGNVNKSYSWINDTVILSNYSCNETGIETSKVITTGTHILEFNFGGQIAIAQNYAPATRPGMLVYGQGTNTSPRYRFWNGTAFSSEVLTHNYFGVPEWSRVSSNPIYNEYLVVVSDNQDDVNVQLYTERFGDECWFGQNSCDQVFEVEDDASQVNRLKADGVFEQLSGDGLLVWVDRLLGARYRTWNGTWSVEAAVPTTLLGGVPTFVKMVSRPNSDEVALILTNASATSVVAALDIMIWNGTDWNCEPSVLPYRKLTPDLYQHADLAYEQLSGDLFVVNTVNVISDINYTTKAADTCTFVSNQYTSPIRESEIISVSARRGGNQILVGVFDITNSEFTQGLVWDGNAFLRDSGVDITSYPETIPYMPIAPAWAGTSDFGLLTYSDEAVSLNVDYFRYNISTNAWGNANASYDATGLTGFTDEEHDIISYSFLDENWVMTIVRDDTDDLWAKIYNGDTQAWSDADGGVTLNNNIASPAFQSFEFAFRLSNITLTPVNVTLLAPLNYTFFTSSSVNFTFNVTTQEFSIMNCSLYTNGSGWSSKQLNNTLLLNSTNNTINYTFVEDGSYIWNILCSNSIGDDRFARENLTLIIDTTIPDASFSSITPNPANHSLQTVSVVWTANDTSLHTKYVNVSYPNGTFISVHDTNFTLDSNNLTVSGNYTLALFVNDTAGNIHLVSEILTINDVIGPNISINYPVNNTFTTDPNIVFSYSILDASQIKNCSLHISPDAVYQNSSFIDSPSYNNFSIYLPTTEEWFIECFDFFENRGVTDNFTIMVDLNPVSTLSGLLVYGEASETSPRYRFFDGSEFVSELNATDIGGIIEWAQVVSNPMYGEYMVVTSDDQDDVNAQLYTSRFGSVCWYGENSCDQVFEVEDDASQIDRLKADGAFEQLSGDGMVVWIDRLLGARYRTFNGTWSDEAAVPATLLGGIPTFVKIASKPNSNEIAIILTNASATSVVGALDIMTWNGTDWDCEPSSLPSSTLAISLYQHADLAYEQSSGELFVASTTTETSEIDYTNKSADSCSFQTRRTSTLSEIGEYIVVGAQYGSDYILISEQDIGAEDMHSIIWSGDVMLQVSGTEGGLYPDVFPNMEISASWAGQSKRGVLVYSDAATSLTLDYMLYNKTENAWEGGTTGLHVGTGSSNFSDEEQNILAYSFLDENKTLVIVQDDLDDLWAKIYDAENNVWADADNGAFLENSESSATFPSFDFAFRSFVDRTPPYVILFNPMNNTISSDAFQNFTFNVSPTSRSLSSCSVYTNESGWSLKQSNQEPLINNSLNAINLTFGEDGTFIWNVECEDGSGNKNSSMNNYTITIDTGQPFAEFSSVSPSPANHSLNNVTVVWTANDAHLSAKYLNISYPNGSLISIHTTNFTLTPDNLTVVGNYSLHILINDTAGHSRVENYNLSVIDVISPNVTLYSPANMTSTSNADVAFLFNVSDATELINCTLHIGIDITQLNQSYINRSQTNNFSLSLFSLSDYWYIDCFDMAGNKGISGNYTLTIDTSTPTLSYKPITPDNNTFLNTTSFVVNISHTETNPDTIVLFINGSIYSNKTYLSGTNKNTNFSVVVADGFYQYNVSINDTAGSRAVLQYRNITIDTTYPSISFIDMTPENNSNISSSFFSINLSHSEINPNVIKLFVNGNLNVTRSYSGQYTNFSLAGLPDGLYVYSASLNDSAGNFNQTSNRTIRKDSTVPSLLISQPDNFIYSTTGNILFMYNVTDNLLGIKNCSLIVDNLLNATNSTITESVFQNFSLALGSGFYNWSIRCFDNINNVNTSSARNITVDKTFPSISNESINGTIFNVNKKVCLNVTINDTYSGMAFVKVEILRPSGNRDNASLTNDSSNPNKCTEGENVWSSSYVNNLEGNYNWSYTYAQDNAGNLNVTSPKAVLNWTAISSIFLTTSILNPVQNFEINESETSVNYSFQQYCNVTCRDDSTEDCQDVHIYPQFNNGSWNFVTPDTNQLISDIYNESCGLLTVGASCNNSFTIVTGQESGNNNFSLRCYSTSANAPISFSALQPNATVNDHPNAGFTYPLNGTYLNGIQRLNASSTSDDQGISSYSFELDNLTAFSSSTILCDSADANCSLDTNQQSQCANNSFACFLRLNASDNDGLKNYTIISVAFDNLNPAVNLVLPSNNSWSSSASIQFRYIPSDPALLSCTLYHNASGIFSANRTNSTISSDVQQEFSMSLVEGSFVWNVLCNDSAGNSAFNTSNYSINIDLNVPSIQFAGGTAQNNSYLDQSWIFVNVSASDSFESNITFYLINSTLGMLNSSTYPAGARNINFSANNTNMIYYYNVTVRDLANNKNSTETRKLTLDSLYPQILYSGGTADNDSYLSQNWIFVNVSITETNPSNLTFALYNTSGIVNQTVLGQGNRSINFTSLDSNNIYYYNVTVLDLALHQNSTITRNITLDTTIPQVALNEPSNNSFKGSDLLQFNFTPLDTNLKNCSLYTNFSGVFAKNLTNTSPVSNQKNSLNPSQIPSGSYVWNILCIDKAGNSAYNSSNFSLSIDSSAPVLFNLYAPLNYTQSQNLTPMFIWNETTDDNFLNYTLLIDDNIAFSSINFRYSTLNITNTTFYVPPATPLASNTKYYWFVVAYDSAGNSINSNETFYYVTDSQAPTVTGISPTNNTLVTVSSTITFEYNVSDINEVSNCSLILNEEIYDFRDAPPQNQSLSFVESLANGFYNWSVNCTDFAGNTNSSLKLNFSVNVAVLNRPYPLFVYHTIARGAEPKYREYQTDTFTAQSSAINITSTLPEWFVLKSNKVRDEFMMATLDSSGHIKAQTYNGSGWYNFANLTIGVGTTEDNYKGMDISYEKRSGRGIIVYNTGVAGTDTYSVWNGTAWSINGTLPVDACLGTTRWVRTAAAPRSNEIVVVYSDSNGDVCGHIWNGAAWVDNKTFDAAPAAQATQSLAVAYEQQTDDILVSWESSTAGIINYCEFSNSTRTWCSLPSALTDRGTANSWMQMASDTSSNRIMLATIQVGQADLDAIEWDGDSFVTWAGIDQNTETTENNFDVAYIGSTGNAMLVWVGINNDYTNYSICSGANCGIGLWSSSGNTTNMAFNCGEAVDMEFVELEADPYSNKLMMTALSQTNQYKCAQEYDGNAWKSWNSNLGLGPAAVNAESKRFSYNYFIDSIIPGIFYSLPTPLNQTYTNETSIIINATANDQYDITNCFLDWNGTNLSMSLSKEDVNYFCSRQRTGLTDGIYNYRVYANDSSGNINVTEQRVLIIDTIFPIFTFSSVSPNQANFTFTNISVVFTASDQNLNTSFVNVSYPNGTVFATYYINLTLTPQNLTAPGNYTLTGFAKDKVNQSIVSFSSFKVNDVYTPGVQLVNPANNTVTRNQLGVFTYIPDDDFNISNCTLVLNYQTNQTNATIIKSTQNNISTSLLEQNYNWSIFCTDTYNNTNHSETRQLAVDLTNPAIAFAGGTSENDTHAARDWIFMNITYDETNFANTTFVLHNSSMDLVNRTVFTNRSTFLNITSLPNTNEIYYYNVTVADNAGNKNSTETRRITLDTINPQVIFVNLTEANDSIVDRNWIYLNLSIIDLYTSNISFYLYNSTSGLINHTLLGAGNTSLNFTGIEDTDTWYYYNATVRDKASNLNRTETRKITLDTVNPQILFTALTVANDTFTNKDYFFVQVSIDESNFQNVTFALHNQSSLVNLSNFSTQQLSINFTGIINTNMQYYYNVTVVDKVSRSNITETRLFTIDTLFPQINFSDPTFANNSYASNNWIFVNVSINDTNTANLTFYLYNDSGLVNQTLLGAGNTSINFTSLEITDGRYYYNVTVRDKASNSNSTERRQIILDNTVPAINLQSPVNNSFDHDGVILFLYTPSDPNLASCTLYHNASGQFVANETNSTVISGVQDLMNHTFPEGHFVWNVRCNDSSGNSRFNSSNLTFAVDTTNPQITFSGDTLPNIAFIRDDWIFVNVSINESNFANITFYLFNSLKSQVNKTTYYSVITMINFTSIVDTDERYYYNVTIYDLAGNSNSTETRQITIDTLLPSIVFSAATPQNNSFFNRDWINVNVTVVEANDANITFYLFNQTIELINSSAFGAGVRGFNFTGLNRNFRYYYNVTAWDNASNKNSTETRIITLDSLFPSIDYVFPTPLNGSNLSAVSFVVNISHTEINPSRIQIFINNTLNLSVPYSGNFTNLTISGLNNGVYSYFVQINDSANNSNRTPVQIIGIDSIPPVIYLESPQNNTLLNNNTVIFRYNVSDATFFVSNCTLYIANTLNQTNHSIRELVSQNFTATVQNGNFSWYVNCSDNVGNYNSSEAKLLRIDTTYPSIENPHINSTNISIYRYVCLNATIDDNHSNIDSVITEIKNPSSSFEDYVLSDTSTTSCDETNGDGIYSVEFIISQVGIYNWTRIFANDTAGNLNASFVGLMWNSSSLGTLTVNLTYPVFSIEINESETSINYTYLHQCLVACDISLQNCSNVYLTAEYNVSGTSELSSDSLFLRNANVSHFCGNLSAGGDSCNVTFSIHSSVDAGTESFRVRCKANSTDVGNYISLQSINVSINDHPVASFVYPLNGTLLHGADILNASNSSDDQGISNYLFEVDNLPSFSSSSQICSALDSNCTFETSVQSQCANESFDCFLRLTATDTDGLSNSTIVSVMIDNLYPFVNITNPKNFTNLSSNLSWINATINDGGIGVNMTFYEYRENSTSSFISICNGTGVLNSCLLNLSSIADTNQLEVRVIANDSFGNMAPYDTRLNITIDKTAPFAILSYPISSENITTVLYTLNATVTDSLSPISYVTFQYRSNSQSQFQIACVDNDSQAPYSCVWNLTNLGDGVSYEVRVNANDTLGNNGSFDVHTNITVERSGPLINALAPGNDTFRLGNVTFYFNVTYDIHAITNCSLIINSTINQTNISIIAGTPTNFSLTGVPDVDLLWNITCADQLGLVNSSPTRLLRLDNTPPITSLDRPIVGENISSVTFTVNASVSDSRIGVNVTTFEFRENSSKNFALACRDSDGQWPFACTWNTLGLNDTSTYEVRSYSNDSLGNNGTVSIHTNITLDKTPPSLALSSPANNTFTIQNVTFTYLANDVLRTVANCSLILNGTVNATNSTINESISQNFTVENMNNGRFLWRINCTDDLGNVNASQIRDLTIDTLAPTAILSYPIPFDNISASLFTVNASVLDQGIGVNVSTFEYRHNDTGSWLLLCKDSISPYSCSWNTSSLDEGTIYQVRVIANDSLGYVSSYSNATNISIDHTPPSLQIIYPSNNTQLISGASLNFTYNASDALLAIETCQFIFNNTLNQTNLSVVEGIVSEFSLNNVPNSNYTWRINCTDSAGNSNISALRKLIVAPDTDPPNITLVSPENGYVSPVTSLTFSYQVNDTVSGISNCSFIVNGLFNRTNSSAVIENATNTFALTNLPDGNYSWSVNCTDDSLAKNKGNSSTLNFTIQEATEIIAYALSDHDYYEKVYTRAENANLSGLSLDVFTNSLKTNMTLSLIHANTTIPWWNGSYLYRSLINVTPPANQELPANFTVNYTVDTQALVSAGKMQSDADDLRIVYYDAALQHNVELDRIVESNNSAATNIFFRVPNTIANQSHDANFYMYFGNDSVINPPVDRSNVLFYLDKFDGDTLANYNTTKGFNDPDEDDDSTLAFSSGTIRYDGTTGFGKSLRMQNFQIRDVAVKADMNLDELPGGSRAFYELGTRIEGESFYYMNIPNENFFSAEIGRYNNGTKTILLTKTLNDYIFDVYYTVEFRVYNINGSTVALEAFINNSLAMSFNDSAVQNLMGPGFVGIGSLQFTGNWDNFSVQGYPMNSPGAASGQQENLVIQVSGETNSGGRLSFVYNVSGLNFTNYSLVSAATKPPYFNDGAGAKGIFITSDITPAHVTLNNPIYNFNTSNTTLSFNWTADDRSSLNMTCNLSINGAVNISNKITYDANDTVVDVQGLNDGIIFWNVSCMDEFNNTNSSSTNFFTVVGGPVNLMATLAIDNRSITLNWSNKTYADSFNIYISENHRSFPSSPNASGIRDLNWTDTSASDSVRRFYKVESVRGQTNVSSSETAGKHEVNAAINWSMVSLPLAISEFEMKNSTNNGYQLSSDPGCVVEIWRYNQSLADPWEVLTYEDGSWLPGTGDENFTSLEPGRGYFFFNNLSSSCNFSFVGVVPSQNITKQISNNTNIIGWYSEDTAELPDYCEPAYPFEVNPINSAQILFYYNSTEQRFKGTFHYDYDGCPLNDWGWFPDSNSEDFTEIVPSRSYYMITNNSATWTIESLH